MLLPNTSLTFTPDMPRAQLQPLYKQYNISREASTTHLGGWQVVWKLGSDKKPVPLAVQCGITDFNNTQLVQGDLHEGDVLITGQQSTGTSSATPRSAIGAGPTGGAGPRR
jgi:hypothetical protein